MENELQAYREHINECDHMLRLILRSRMRVCRLVGEYKKKEGLEVWQSNRYQELKECWVSEAEQEGLSAAFAEQIFEAIHTESVRLQNVVQNPGE